MTARSMDVRSHGRQFNKAANIILSKRLAGLAAILGLALSNWSAEAAAERAKCSLNDYRANVFLEQVPCSVTWTDPGAVVTIRGRVYRVIEVARQGQWASVQINGRPGMRYELNRSEFRYSTSDVNGLSIDIDW